MQPLEHQEKASNALLRLLHTYQIAYLFGEPRSGKTLTALHAAMEYLRPTIKRNILILTKKAALEGWNSVISSYDCSGFNIKVTNYQQVMKLDFIPDFYIQDESHNCGGVGKPSLRVQQIRSRTFNCPALLLSGTPIVETALSIYYQCSVTKFSPFANFKNFYDFFRFYGIPHAQYIGVGRSVESYSRFKPELLERIDQFSVKMTLKDAGMSHNNIDKLHYLEPSNEFKFLYNEALTKRVLKVTEFDNIALDTVSKLRTTLHLLESGIYVDEGYRYCKISEFYNAKLKLLNTITKGFKESTAIMCHFVAEQRLLAKTFEGNPNVKVFSSTADSEGVDLSGFKYFIIYSQDYSGARFIQRRNRVVNLNKHEDTEVHFILIKNAISEQVYNCVNEKRNFNDSTFEQKRI